LKSLSAFRDDVQTDAVAECRLISLQVSGPMYIFSFAR
jgi:hypothetical protein